ncbi:MAG: DUF6600 domain-containing protein [Candidatus Aminicenantales bacterium]
MRKTLGFMIVLIFSLSFLNAEEQDYTNYSFARLSHVTGNTYIQRAADLGYEEGVINMPIAEGDRLGTTEGRAEIYLGKGNYIRLDNNTKIDFLKLPDRESALIQIQVWTGNLILSLRTLEEEKNIEIHTPDVSLYLLDRGLYRVDVRENGETEIFVFDGLLEASAESGSVLVKREQRIEAINGHFTSSPARFYAVAEDSFDRWSEHRDSQIRKRLARRYLPEELEDFEYELAVYGHWNYMSPYGYVWVPSGLNPFWRPYFHGRWVWMPCGWTWLPYEPWGWVTFHFGRWHWSVGLGWYWIPRTVWGPAWVSWYWGYDYVGWVPLSYYDRPVVIINNVFYDRYKDPYYPYNSRALTVVHKNELKAKHISRVALSPQSVKSLGKIQLSRKPISLRPAPAKVTVDKLGGSKVFLRKKDSSVRFKPVKRPSSTTSTTPKAKTTLRSREKISGRAISTKKRTIIKRKIGYPSFSDTKSRTPPKIKKSTSTLDRIYRYITRKSPKPKSRSVSRPSSKDKSSTRSISRSSSRSSSSSRVKKSSSSSRSSSKSSRTRSGKVKKKK